MKPGGTCLHFCSCQHPVQSVCWHRPAYVQWPHSAVGVNSSPSFRAACGGLSAALWTGYQEGKLMLCH